MRTKFSALIVTLTLAVGLVGHASNIKEKEITNLSSYLNKTIRFPSFAENLEIQGTVSLLVWVDENQKLQHSNIEGTDSRFEKYVEDYFENLEKKPVKFSEKVGVKKVNIKFKLIS